MFCCPGAAAGATVTVSGVAGVTVTVSGVVAATVHVGCGTMTGGTGGGVTMLDGETAPQGAVRGRADGLRW